MKNYSKTSSRKDSGDETSNCNQSLFMDDSTEDLENYLNTPLTKNGDEDERLYFEQELECSTMNALSRNIKGKFQRSSKDSKKNKFFKSKSSEEKAKVGSNSNEIPVINEAMKKILKETPYKPHSKHSPKALKTYSNKHRDTSLIVESFGLPDQPFVSVDTGNLKERDSIDLDSKTDDDSFDMTCLFSSWIFNQTESSEIDLNEDFRRKSFSTIQNVSLGGDSLETEVRDCFNFEEDVLIPDVKSSLKQTIIDSKICPVVSLKPFNFNDIRQFEANDLSPLKNKKQLLFERWNEFNSKLNNFKPSPNGEVPKAKPQMKSIKNFKCTSNKTYSRRSTRSNNLYADSKGIPNTVGPVKINNALDSPLYSPEKIVEKNEKKFEEAVSTESPIFDILSPRRSMRRSGQQIIASISVNATDKKSPTNFKSPTKRIEINDEVTLSELQEQLTKQKIKNVLKNDIATEQSSKVNNSTGEEKSSEQNGDLLKISELRTLRKTSPVKKLTDQKDTDILQKADASKRKSQRLNPKPDNNPVNPSVDSKTEVDVHSADSSFNKTDANMNTSVDEEEVIAASNTKATVKKRRGRPRKVIAEMGSTLTKSDPSENIVPYQKQQEQTKKDGKKISTELLENGRDNECEKGPSELKEYEKSDFSQPQCLQMDDKKIALKNSNILIHESQPLKNGENIQNQIKCNNVLNGKIYLECKKDEEISDSGKQEYVVRKRGRPRKKVNKIVLNGKNIAESGKDEISILSKEEPLKRKRGRTRKRVNGLKQHEEKTIRKSIEKEIELCNSDVLNGNDRIEIDESLGVINPQVKICDNNIDKAEKYEEKGSCDSSVLNHCEKKVELEANEHFDGKGISEPSDGNKICNGSTEECIEELPNPSVEEMKISEILSKTEEPTDQKDKLEKIIKRDQKQSKTEESLDQIDYLERKIESDKKKCNTEEPPDVKDKLEKKIEKDQKTEFISEQYKENNAVHHDLLDEKKEKFHEAYSTSKISDESQSKTLENVDNVEQVQFADDTKTTERYLDFGYDIHRRTSFRKILERVMEASRLEMEMTKSEDLRIKRCKSVPHEEFHRDREANEIYLKAFSADAKLRFLKEKKNSTSNIKNVDISKVRKRLDYNTDLKSQDGNFSMRKRTKSFHVAVLRSSNNVEHTNIETSSKPLSTSVKPKEGIVRDKSLGGSTPKSSDNIRKETEHTNPDLEQIIPANSDENILDRDDLEVEDLMLGEISSDKTYERRRCKSFSEASLRNKILPKSKSVMRKKIKKIRRVNGSAESPVFKKVHEFAVGDLVWGKIGTYPYWPGLIVEDPETSDFKKFRLFRTTPYYHVRFFGDNGKRAWTLHCIPYEGPNDLDVFKEQSRAEGTQNYDFVVKASHRTKWQRAVEEAEMVKSDPIEKRLGFFDVVLLRKETLEGKSHFESKDVPEMCFNRVRSKSFSCVDKNETNHLKSNNMVEKPKIRMKESSLLACIENVVRYNSTESSESEKRSPSNRHSVPACEEDKTANSTQKNVRISKDSPSKSPPRKRSIPMKDNSILSCIDDVVNKFRPRDSQSSLADFAVKKSKRSKRKSKEDDSETDLDLELLSIPAPDPEALETQERLTNRTSTSIGTPVTSRKNAEVPLKRTRSKSIYLEKRRLSQEFKHERKESAEGKEFRMKSKRRTIGVCESNGVMVNDCISRLSEQKKNIFRGVPKEKVCQICEKAGEVVKCRGPCNGDFHVKCIENSLRETEESTLKEEVALKERGNRLLDNKQVEISTIVSRKKFADNVVLSPVNNKIPMMEQFDRKMKELMSQVESRISVESNESSSEDADLLEKNRMVDTKEKNGKKRKSAFKHVTADDVRVINLSDPEVPKSKTENPEQLINADEGVYKCPYCTSTVIPPCFVCNSIVSTKGNSMRQRCSLQKCGRYYHLECLNVWHQTQWSFILHDKRKTEAFDSFVCPRHSCHICASENSGFSMGRCPNDKLVKCLRCPATYHNSYHCVPAGTDILTSTQIVCPRHVDGNKKSNTLNTIWCFVCSEGGNLICCETCPTSVHAECLPVNLLDDDTYICEDCESGRFPLYDEVVWVKCGSFRWWPAIILFPNEVPANVESKPHSKGEFVVKFFGTYNYFWVGRGRAFLYQEGDTGYLNSSKNKIDEAFSRALMEAADVYRFKKGLRAKKQKEVNNGLKPPPYVKIKVNRPVGNVKVFEGNLSNTTPCECDPKDKSPCGPNSSCLNRILLTECNPEICPAGQRCKNQCFEKREYPQVVPYRTTGRGWGLKTLEPINKGRFVIEYVGEIIDDEEYQRRITRMHQQKDENYYFLTIDKDRMLDAGPKGNVARFMNHSCQPNCETQKWTVNGDTRVGLFAIEDISIDSELTFNYNLECVGTEKKICRCGAPNCSGFIGVKPEDQKPLKKNSSAKSVEPEKQDDAMIKDTCFICRKGIDVGKCSNKTCFRSYHLECVQLDSWPNGKWNCPSHNCNICSKRTSRICVLCNNSYCPYHSDGNIRYDDSLGFLCSEHDQTNKKTRRKNRTLTGSIESTSSNGLDTPQRKELLEAGKSESLRSERYKKRSSCSETHNPRKRIKLDK